MATSGTFYLDAPSLSTATVVYSNAALTTVAANGFYSEGSIVREQASGVLLPQQSCPACAVPCGGTISEDGAQGIYYLNVDLGTPTGAVLIEFDPLFVPDGIKAVYNSVVYNGVSSPVYGWLQGSAGLPTYIGEAASDCGMVAGSPYTLNEFQYDGSDFISLGTTTPVTVLAGQLDLTVLAPGNTLMVIPKTAASPSILNLEFIGPCSGTVFNVSVTCPAALPSFDSSTMHATSVLACAAAIGSIYYVAHVNGAAGVLGLYDLVFSDANGQSKLSAGFYKTNDAGANDWYQVDANGVIIAFGTCAVACGGIITGSGTQGVYYVETNLGTATGAVIVKFNPQSIPDGILATYNSVNYNGVSSPLYGWLQGTIGEPTYIGALGDDCGIVAGSPYTLNEFEYNGSAFVSLGTTTSISVGAGQMELTALPPGNTVMVIPKIAASPSLLNLEFIGVCGDTGFTIDVTCPAALTSFASSTGNGDSASACSATISPTYYVAHVTGSGGVLGIYDLVFSDANGQFKLGSGYYKTTAAGANNWYQVDFNGVIIAFGTCP
jgi:hypothetical protein